MTDAETDGTTDGDAETDAGTDGHAETDAGAAPDAAPIRVAFVCVQNAGRSQMSAAFAERERADRGLEDRVEILTGGTHPAERVHEAVVESMAEDGFDLADREPREITTAELETCHYVATMGCSTLDLDAGSDGTSDGDAVDVRDWALADPDGEDPGRVREIRAEIEERVSELFDEIERELALEREQECTGEATVDE